MSDTSTTTTTTDDSGAGDGTDGTGTGERTFTQAELDRIIADRLRRENVTELRTKAAELDRLRETTKSAEDRAAERLADLERKLTEAETDRLRLRIAARHKLSDDDAELFLTGADEETLERQAKALAERTKATRHDGTRVDGEGRAPSRNPGDDGKREFARQLFGRDT
jgi:hypothetical protein